AGTRSALHRWGRWEGIFQSSTGHGDPVHAVALAVDLVAPSGAQHTATAFWDGERTWRVRHCPHEAGTWAYTTRCTPADPRFHGQRGSFAVVPYDGDNPLYRHGAVRLAASRHHLAHADGTPFFYLGDTAWNAPMVSTADDWDLYLRNRAARSFNAVQFLATQ